MTTSRLGVQFAVCLLVYFSLGSLVVERGPGRPPIPNHQAGPRLDAPSGSLSVSAAQQRQSTLAQLQLQVGLPSQFF